MLNIQGNKVLVPHRILERFKNLKQGQTVLLKIHGLEKKGLWKMSVQGQNILAKSDLLLHPGDTKRAIVQWEGSRLFFKIIHHSTIDRTEFSNISNDVLIDIFVDVLIKAGMPLYYTEQLYKGAKKIGNQNKAVLRVLALLLDKGFPLTSKVMEIYLPLLLGSFNYSDKNDHNEEKQGLASQSYESDQNRYSDRHPDPHQNHHSPPDYSSLQLFNHLKGKHSNWIIIPFSYSCFEGLIRVKKAKSHYQTYYSHMTLSVRYKKNNDLEWHVQVRPTSSQNKVLTLYCNDPEYRQRAVLFLGELSKKLGNLSIEIDDKVREAKKFNAFGDSEIDIQAGIDTLV